MQHLDSNVWNIIGGYLPLVDYCALSRTCHGLYHNVWKNDVEVWWLLSLIKVRLLREAYLQGTWRVKNWMYSFPFVAKDFGEPPNAAHDMLDQPEFFDEFEFVGNLAQQMFGEWSFTIWDRFDRQVEQQDYTGDGFYYRNTPPPPIFGAYQVDCSSYEGFLNDAAGGRDRAVWYKGRYVCVSDLPGGKVEPLPLMGEPFAPRASRLERDK